MNATLDPVKDSATDSVSDSITPTNSWHNNKSAKSRAENAKNTIDSVQTLFEINQLNVSYHGVSALKDINLNLASGHITALIGPSGCGKSSFLNCLNRMTDLIAHCTVSGQIRLNNHDINHRHYDVTSLRRQVGMIFQKPNPLPLSIVKNFELPLKEHGVDDPHEISHIVENSLRAVGLWPEVKDRLKKSALQLSGGQQQRLCIARALALDPDVILLDEPCSALDPLSSALVEDLIKQMHAKYTVVIVTHNLAQAKRISDFTALLWLQEGSGQLIEFGTTPLIFEQPQNALTAAYISGVRG